jgi:hypothetical protein
VTRQILSCPIEPTAWRMETWVKPSFKLANFVYVYSVQHDVLKLWKRYIKAIKWATSYIYYLFGGLRILKIYS